MADNINVTAGAGKTIGADEITSVLYQRVKLIEGADGTNDGDISATNPLPVELRDVDTTLVADVGAIKTSVQTLDNAIAGSEMQVDVVSLPSVTGTVTANAGTNLNTSALALETGGNLATIAGKDFATQTTLAALNTKVTACDTGSVTIAALPNEGQQTMANSISVAIASNQSAIPVTTNVTSTITCGRKVVTSAGTAVPLVASSTPCTKIIITAETDNTDYVVVGGTAVIAAIATRTGIPLLPSQSITLDMDDVSTVYIDSMIDGEGVTFIYLN